MRNISVLVAFALLSLTGCYTNTSSTISDERPSIAFIGGQSGDSVYVNGIEMGDASEYDADPKVLFVEAGRNLVEVKSKKGSMILSTSVMLDKGQIRKFSLGSR
jgi:hypothetical protein